MPAETLDRDILGSQWGSIIWLFCLCAHHASAHMDLRVNTHAPEVHLTTARVILDRHSTAGMQCLE